MSDKEHAAHDVVLDVREDLRQGREPFQKIMSAAQSVAVGSSLVLYATFKPTPLLAVLRGQGFESEVEPIGNGEWKVVFRRTAEDPAAQPDAKSATQSSASAPLEPNGASGSSDPDVVLDNRGLEPPEPMVRTLEAINRLKPGGRIVGHYDRRPMFLIPKLEQMGYSYDVTQNEDGSATLVISAPNNG